MTAFMPVAGKKLVDGTLGGGGHARALLEAGAAELVGLDWDVAALERCHGLQRDFAARVRLIHAPYDCVAEVLAGQVVDGVLLDLGFSSDQLDDGGRGLSYHVDGPLDMRLDSTLRRTAADLLAQAREEDLVRIFRDFGEEPKARVLARRVVHVRKATPLATTQDLLRLVEQVYPPRHGLARAHPAARIFQALRIAVNDELAVLERALPAAAACLQPGGRLVVITFQPLEERLVKRVFRALCEPVRDVLGREVAPAPYRMLKKVVPSAAEVAANPRARSATLRGIERSVVGGLS